MQSARLHMSLETAGCRAAEQLARSSMHLRAVDSTAASCLHRLRYNLTEAGLSISRRHISSSIQASERGSVATDRSAAVSSEWDDVLDLASDKKPQKQGRSGGRESRGGSRISESSRQPAASSSGWGDDWDLSSDRSTRKEGSTGVQGSWGTDKRYGGSDSRRGGTEGRGRGTGSRGRGTGRGSDPSRNSWEGRGSQASSSNRWDGGTAAPSRDSWGSSSRGQASEARGKLSSSLKTPSLLWKNLPCCMLSANKRDCAGSFNIIVVYPVSGALNSSSGRPSHCPLLLGNSLQLACTGTLLWISQSLQGLMQLCLHLGSVA